MIRILVLMLLLISTCMADEVVITRKPDLVIVELVDGGGDVLADDFFMPPGWGYFGTYNDNPVVRDALQGFTLESIQNTTDEEIVSLIVTKRAELAAAAEAQATRGRLAKEAYDRNITTARYSLGPTLQAAEYPLEPGPRTLHIPSLGINITMPEWVTDISRWAMQ